MTLSFIERIIQGHFEALGQNKIAQRSLSSMISYAKRNNLIDEFILERINILRQKRNPFAHTKPYDYEYSISQRIFNNIKNSQQFKQPLEILENDAKDALSLMYTVLVTKF